MLTSSDLILTENFENDIVISGSDNNRKLEWMHDMEEKRKYYVTDSRTHFYCAEPTLDARMYYNYLMLMNKYQDSWVSYGLLDAGYVPFIMLPRFNNSSKLKDELLKLANELLDVDLYPLSGISFFSKQQIKNVTDYWIRRDLLYEKMKILSEIEEFPYKYDMKSELDATMTNFLRPLVFSGE